MADVNKLTPHILKWEGGFVNDPDDLGGATNMGVTMNTYIAYCRRKGYPVPTVTRLKNLSEKQWTDILKTMYWDRFRADEIHSQSVADICVDWLWLSGVTAIKRVQSILGVKPDGIVGPVTLSAINSRSALPLFGAIKQSRLAHIDELCTKRPKNEKYRLGWTNRLNDLVFQELTRYKL